VRSIASLATALLLLACAPQATPASTSSTAHRDAPADLTYLGVAGWRVDDGANALLVDPFFSRTRLEDGGAMLSPDPGLIARYAPAHANAILVGHSHYDHLLDVPDIAKRTGATIVGTESTFVTAHREARFSDRRGLEVGPRVASG
jgi:L-ascorbate metabolism protein UlaG (beta-lactamase superfamily)